ncbi:MAG TPA: FAD-binding protein [Polyangiaceae bacterium]
MNTLSRELPEVRKAVVVIGGGIAGMWTAYQLARAGVPSALVSYTGTDRGGVQGASRRSAGAVNTAPLRLADLDGYLRDLGRGQSHPDLARILRTHLAPALADLEELVELRPVKIGKALAHGPGHELLDRLSRAYRELGGVVIDGWVTRLVADQHSCRGVQYETPSGIGKVRAANVVLATGGYAGLFGNAIRTNCFGTMLGRFLHAGGLLSNLEFVFKHGYGNIDANAVTPTEELPGAEIRDAGGSRVAWLEETLFSQEGTRSHLAAVQFWSQNASTKFFVDLRYRPLYLRVAKLKKELERAKNSGETSSAARARAEFVESFPAEGRALVEHELAAPAGLDFAAFERLKRLSSSEPPVTFRVAPLIYFTMGGVAHSRLRTNLPGVFVTGEAMHDFGANRVGGLPWAMYLASGCQVRDELATVASSDSADFELVVERPSFSSSALESIQSHLSRALGNGVNPEQAERSLAWTKSERTKLGRGAFGDIEASLLLAEAILQSALLRRESRGFFLREDHPAEDPELGELVSRARYEPSLDEIEVTLCSPRELARECRETWIDSWPAPVHESASNWSLR